MFCTDSITTCSTNAEEFFARYVKERKPCHFRDHFKEKEWGLDKWTNEYLKENCNSEVKIEYRDSSSDRFGKGKEIQMPYNKVVEEIENGSQLYYMTTQKLDYTAEGQAAILSPPMSSLQGDFPINPPLLGNLIVQNINMWMGASVECVTSGLHHDYHDNLYIVLRGTKVITLYAPTEHPNMYTVGVLEKLHPNGRVNYKGCLTRADGSDINSERALQASMDLENAMLCMQKKDVEGSDNDSDIENALEDLLDAQIACNDDYSNSEEEEEEDEVSGAEDDIPLDLPIPTHVLHADKRKRCDVSRISVEDSVADDDDDGADGVTLKKHREMAERNLKEESETGGAPPNFSLVETSLPPKELKERFPKFAEAQARGAAMTVTLNAGQMLYLPAGWFHEVRSVGAPPLGHMAMNYWFHPPDGNAFAEPYSSQFWKKDWECRVASSNI